MTARRKLLAALGLSVVALSGAALAQARRAKVGWLTLLPRPQDGSRNQYILGVLNQLKKRGWTEGLNLELEIRGMATGHTLAAAVAELVAMKPDVIITAGTAPTRALRDATTEVPIVAVVGDPVASGLVASLARPGGNVTGVSFNELETGTKALGLLHEMVPHARRIDGLFNATSPVAAAYAKTYVEAVRLRGLQAQPIWVREVDDLEPAIASASADAVLILTDALFLPHLQRIAAAGIRRKLPLGSVAPDFAGAGGLFSYSGDREEQIRLTADFVDRILRGGKPADMPVEQISRFVLAINLATARTIGVTVHRTMLLRADHLIE